jgi:hypothetical protein
VYKTPEQAFLKLSKSSKTELRNHHNQKESGGKMTKRNVYPGWDPGTLFLKDIRQKVRKCGAGDVTQAKS